MTEEMKKKMEEMAWVAWSKQISLTRPEDTAADITVEQLANLDSYNYRFPDGYRQGFRQGFTACHDLLQAELEAVKAERDEYKQWAERLAGALRCYEDFKTETPNSEPHEEYVAFKVLAAFNDFKKGKGEG